MSEAKGFLSKYIESAFRKESFESLRQSHELSVDDEVLQDLQGLREHQNLRRLWPRFYIYFIHLLLLGSFLALLRVQPRVRCSPGSYCK